jgi:hypothetical protein
MTSAKNPDGSVDYFAQHKGKPPPTFVTPKGAAAGKKKTVIAPGPRPDGTQPLQGDYLNQQDQAQERE